METGYECVYTSQHLRSSVWHAGRTTLKWSESQHEVKDSEDKQGGNQNLVSAKLQKILKKEWAALKWRTKSNLLVRLLEGWADILLTPLLCWNVFIRRSRHNVMVLKGLFSGMEVELLSIWTGRRVFGSKDRRRIFVRRTKTKTLVFTAYIIRWHLQVNSKRVAGLHLPTTDVLVGCHSLEARSVIPSLGFVGKTRVIWRSRCFGLHFEVDNQIKRIDLDMHTAV